MNNTEILLNIIENIKAENIPAAQDDIMLLPDCKERSILYATVGAINTQPTERAYLGTKSAAISLADRLLGHV